jgi:hypothetical protein
MVTWEATRFAALPDLKLEHIAWFRCYGAPKAISTATAVSAYCFRPQCARASATGPRGRIHRDASYKLCQLLLCQKITIQIGDTPTVAAPACACARTNSASPAAARAGAARSFAAQMQN